MKITFDTNIAERVDLVQAAQSAGFQVFITSVTPRELLPSNIKAVVTDLVPEIIVLDESSFGAVLASARDGEVFEESLKIISNGSFPPKGKRDNLSDGERRQQRDAMIFTAHVSKSYDIFVSDDERAFVRDGRRERLEKLGECQVMTSKEFLLKYGNASVE